MPVSPFTRAVQEVVSRDSTLPSRGGWATPEDVKESLVEMMMGIVQDPDLKPKDRVAAFNALRVADQSQWERDHPVESGKAKGGSTSTVNNNVIIAAASAIRGAIERGELGYVEQLPALNQPNPSGNS